MSYIDQIPDKVKDHIKEISKAAGGEDAVEKISEGWLEKDRLFEEKMNEMGLSETDSFDKDDMRGAIALTRSGSIVNIGPREYSRKVEYTSIGLRSNVPPAAEKSGSELKTDVRIDEPLEFEVGPVRSTSDIYKIAVCPENMDVAEQKETLTNATKVLEEEFVKVNETLQIEE